MRRLLYLGMTRASESLVLGCGARTERGALQPPSQFAEDARLAAGGEWADRGEELFGPDEALHAAFSELRDELMSDLPRVAGALVDLRLDDADEVSHGVVRYLELLKLAAVLRRPEGRASADALAQAGAVLAQGASVVQREMLESSPLDELC